MSTTNRSKRALFNKPSWAAKTSTDIADNIAPVFGQNVVYEDIVAAEKKRREKHAQRAKERAEKEKDKAKKAEKAKSQAVKVGDTKRRRISNDNSEDHAESGSESDAKSTKSTEESSNHSLSGSRTPSPPKERPMLRSTSQRDKEQRFVSGLESASSSRVRPQTRLNLGASTTIILDEEEENESDQQKSGAKDTHSNTLNRGHVSKTMNPESESEEEDEYLRKLKQKAREEARAQRLRANVGKEGTPDTDTRAVLQGSRSPLQAREGSSHPQPTSRQTSVVPDPDDPKVEILIRTMIPGAREMVVTRHASQPLDKVKEFWCQRNELHPAIVSKVFFTWNGTRLFNSTTMRSVITRLKELHPMPDGSDPSMGKIEIEAMTEEILQHRQEQKERRKREAAGLSTNQENDEVQYNTDTNGPANPDTSNEPPAQQAPEKPGLIVKLTSLGIDDMMLRLRPNTTVSKIISGYRKIKKIDPGKECWLVFDGERLEDTQTVEEVEFEHEDTVEVHIK